MLVQSSVTARLLLNRNRMRKSFLLQNVDGTDVMYVKRERGPVFTISSTDYDFRLPPGSSFALNSDVDGKEAIQDSYSVLAAANTPNVAVFETEDVIR